VLAGGQCRLSPLLPGRAVVKAPSVFLLVCAETAASLCLSCCSWKLRQDCEGLSCSYTL